MDDTVRKEHKPAASGQWAEDVAYTVNHAFACTAADLASPYVSHTILSRLFHKHSNWADWFIGEGVGDFAAVPVTIAIKNHAPRTVDAVRKGMESAFGWAFRKAPAGKRAIGPGRMRWRRIPNRQRKRNARSIITR